MCIECTQFESSFPLTFSFRRCVRFRSCAGTSGLRSISSAYRVRAFESGSSSNGGFGNINNRGFGAKNAGSLYAKKSSYPLCSQQPKYPGGISVFIV